MIIFITFDLILCCHRFSFRSVYSIYVNRKRHVSLSIISLGSCDRWITETSSRFAPMTPTISSENKIISNKHFFCLAVFFFLPFCFSFHWSLFLFLCLAFFFFRKLQSSDIHVCACVWLTLFFLAFCLGFTCTSVCLCEWMMCSGSIINISDEHINGDKDKTRTNI